MNKLFILIFSLLPILLFSQEEDTLPFLSENAVLSPNLRTVKCHLAGFPIANPIININSGKIQLSFDDMEGDVVNYTYDVTICNKNWEKTKLEPLEYKDGYTRGDLDEYDFSYNTYTDYTHYRLIFPNGEMSVTRSGNYLLNVYNEDDELVIVRRFLVVEPLVNVFTTMNLPVNIIKQHTHQEIDFKVTYKDVAIQTPMTDISATILQNGRWDNAIQDIQPRYSRLEELDFDYQDKIVFDAGKEFRYADLRNFRNKTATVARLEALEDGFDIYLYTDENREDLAHFAYKDINGKYIIQNKRAVSLNVKEFSTNSTYDENHDLVSDYAFVFFSLDAPRKFDDADVYIFGELSDWQLKDEFKMKYNEANQVYAQRVILKQGYYNYNYTVVPKKSKEISFVETEGNWYETENEYTILIYYTPFGARNDRLIAVHSFSSEDGTR